MTPAITWSPAMKVGSEIVLSGVTARGRNGTDGGASMEQQTLAVLRRVVELVEVKGLVFPDLLVEIDAFANLTVDRHAGH